jgi:hypothetical protein
MAGYDVLQFDSIYVKDNRSIWAQELNLTPAQRSQLAHFAEWNAREENKYYFYDYYRDNCSTRVRDAIDAVTGGAVARALKPLQTNATYRSHTRALTYDNPLLYTGLMIAMGPNIDRPLNAWDESFIPFQLRDWMRKVKVRAPDGSEQPLVRSEHVLFQSTDKKEAPTNAPDLTWQFTIVGVLIAGLFLLLARIPRRGALITLAVLVTAFYLKVGIIGSIIEFLWCCTDHVVTYRNENVLQANSLALALMVLAPAALLGRVWARRWAAWFALVMAGLSFLGFIIQALPNFNQLNGDIIGLLLPVHGVIAYILWRNWTTNPPPARRATP